MPVRQVLRQGRTSGRLLRVCADRGTFAGSGGTRNFVAASYTCESVRCAQRQATTSRDVDISTVLDGVATGPPSGRATTNVAPGNGERTGSGCRIRQRAFLRHRSRDSTAGSVRESNIARARSAALNAMITSSENASPRRGRRAAVSTRVASSIA